MICFELLYDSLFLGSALGFMEVSHKHHVTHSNLDDGWRLSHALSGESVHLSIAGHLRLICDDDGYASLASTTSTKDVNELFQITLHEADEDGRHFARFASGDTMWLSTYWSEHVVKYIDVGLSLRPSAAAFQCKAYMFKRSRMGGSST